MFLVLEVAAGVFVGLFVFGAFASGQLRDLIKVAAYICAVPAILIIGAIALYLLFR